MSTPLKHSEDTFLLTPLMYSNYTYNLAVLVQNLHCNTASYCLQCIIRLLKLDVVFQYCFGYEVWPILKLLHVHIIFIENRNAIQELICKTDHVFHCAFQLI